MYESADADVDAGKIRSFVNGFLNGTLGGKDLKQ